MGKVTRHCLLQHAKRAESSPLVIALILSMPLGSCTLVSSLIGARGALMLAELFTARCLGRETGGNLGASAKALRPWPGAEAR